MTELELAIREACRRVRGKRIEHVIILDPEGVELWNGTGTRRYVCHPDDDHRGCVLVHNHPNGMPFSVQDVNQAIDSGLGEVVAVGDRWAYRLTLPFGRPPAQVVAILNDLHRRGREYEHDQWERLFTLWPAAHYRRIAVSERGATFVAGREGVQEAM